MIDLPFPPSSLSGHNNGAWYSKSRIVATHRAWAFHATKAAKLKDSIPADGDILIHFRFVPPNQRGDRTNYANRLKPYIDGIAEALGINDRRFLPSYEFCEPEKPGRVEVVIHTHGDSLSVPGAVEESGPKHCVNSARGLTTNRLAEGGD